MYNHTNFTISGIALINNDTNKTAIISGDAKAQGLLAKAGVEATVKDCLDSAELFRGENHICVVIIKETVDKTVYFELGMLDCKTNTALDEDVVHRLICDGPYDESPDQDIKWVWWLNYLIADKEDILELFTLR